MSGIIDKINKALDESKGFLESSIISVKLNDEAYFAFPHYKGKKRVTEFGGTSSALLAYNLVILVNKMNCQVYAACFIS